eukprot:TRINITY_DN11816_c0_g1_i2.p1 TRINITY_DN11816_c0_g1~~TRINITY_DN11816_c0_g1_i2.p1  ORF type:complete len:607 (-),score=96.42 TRINITY_DN11816_c0_g1_i2:180-2000(-)
MFVLSDIPFWVAPVVIFGANCLHLRLYTRQQIKGGLRRPKAALEGAWQLLVFLATCLCTRTATSQGDKQRRERLRAKVQALRDEYAELVVKVMREVLAYVLSALVVAVCCSRFLKLKRSPDSISSGVDILEDPLVLFFLWYATCMYVACILFSTPTLFESKFISKADLLVTAHMLVFMAATLFSHHDPLPGSVQRGGGGIVPILFFKPLLVFSSIVGYAGSTFLIGMGNNPDEWPPLLLVATSFSWACNKVIEAYCEAEFEHSQLQGVRSALDAFMTAAYDAVVCLDAQLRIRGAVVSLADFLKLQHLAPTGASSLDTVPFLNFVDSSERNLLQDFFLQSTWTTSSTIATTCNANILLSDGSVVRSQVFHYVDDDLRDGLTHWVALRKLETIVAAPAMHAAVGPQVHEAPSEEFSHRSLSEASSTVSTSASCVKGDSSFLDFCSLSLRLHASAHDLKILSLQADLTQAGVYPPDDSSIGLRDWMEPEDWSRMQEWFNESRDEVIKGDTPDVMRNVSFTATSAGVNLISTEALLGIASKADQEAQVFTLTLNAPLAMPMSRSQMKGHSTRQPKALERIDEDPDTLHIDELHATTQSATSSPPEPLRL